MKHFQLWAAMVAVLLTADTLSMDYFDVSANTWTNVVLVGTAMGQATGNHTEIRWQLEDGLAAGNSGKNLFDDLRFSSVPELGSVTILLSGSVLLLNAKRHMQNRVLRVN